ncbi:Uncharacterized protein pbN1_40180 [Aromatoleum bremense]|nr:Uncharacterized protein pbN1_40180 [Aromatoleum bremense]
MKTYALRYYLRTGDPIMSEEVLLLTSWLKALSGRISTFLCAASSQLGFKASRLLAEKDKTQKPRAK